MRTATATEAWVILSATTHDTPTPPLGPWPTTDAAPIRASYCSHDDGEGTIVFDPIYFGVYWSAGDTARLERCLAVKRRMGLTDVCIAVQGGYRDYLNGATFDWRKMPSMLHDLACWLLERGFRPVIYVCTADGGTHVEIYDGTMQRICEALIDLVKHAWYSIGWEVDRDRGGAFTAGQASDALIVCRRALGEQAMICWHGQPNRTTPASYYGSNFHDKPNRATPLRWVGDAVKNDGAWIDQDDPYDGSEQGAFYVEGSGGPEIDVVLFQTEHGNDGPSYTGDNPGLDQFSQPRWWGRTLECLDRFLEAGTPMPGAKGYQRVDDRGVLHVHPGVAGSRDSAGYRPPDWFASPRRRGRPKWVLWETVCFEYIRDACSDAAVARCTEEAASFGCEHQGCAQ